MANTLNCPVCGKLTDSRLDGCPHCGAMIRKSAGANAGPVQSQSSCPQCGAVVDAGDLVCANCNTNLLTGQKLSEEMVMGGRSGSRFPLVWLVSGGAAAVVAILLGLMALSAITGDPVSRALRLIDEQEYLEAQGILSDYVDDNPDDAEAWFELGKLQWRANELDGAGRSLTRAAELNPSNVDAALWAIVAFSRGGGDRARQLGLLERVAQARPNDAGIWYLLALSRSLANDSAGQIEALEKVVSLRPADDSARWAAGVAKAVSGDFPSARDELSLVGEGPRYGDALAALGFIARIEGADDTAVENLSRALEAEGVTVEFQALTALGQMLMREGRFQEAQLHLERALTIRADDRQARYLRGLCMQARGRPRDALQDFEAVMRDQGHLAAEAGVQAAQAYLDLDMPDRARQAIDQAGRGGASGAAYLTIRGRARASQGEQESALTSYTQAVNADPLYSAAYLERGLLYVRQDAIGRGLRDLEKYLELVGNDTRGTKAADVRALTEQLRQAARAPQRRARAGNDFASGDVEV